MHLVVVYDVNTKTRAGRRRLRQVAKLCLGFGERVQKSVFECCLTERQVADLVTRAETVMDPRLDNLRVYRVSSPEGRPWRLLGKSTLVAPRPPTVVL